MLSGQSVVRVVSQVNNEDPKETIIIKRCKMPELDSSNISEEELNKILEDLDNAHEDDLEYMGDEDLDNDDVPEMSEDDMMVDDIEDEYL